MTHHAKTEASTSSDWSSRMRRPALAVLALLVLALAGCANEPTEDPVSEPTAVSTPTSAVKPAGSASGGYDTMAADLPPAAPIETWVVKGNDFQQTLDLRMQTAMIERLKMPPAEASEEAARSLAYFVCSGLRADPSQSPGNLVSAAYPGLALFGGVGVALAAQDYCIDTLPY